MKLRSASASSTPSCVGVLVADADDYHLYITNLPREEFKPEEISLLYRARWEVELLFKELKSQYALDSFEIGKEEIVRIQVLAALLTISVSRAILRALCDRVAEAEDTRIILLDLAAYYGYPPPDLGEFLYQEAIQPVTRRSLLTDVTNGLAGGSPA